MFYSQLLLAKKGPLSKVWLAAHWEKKLNKAAILSTDIKATVEQVKKPVNPLSLRVSGHLLLGLSRIFAKKVAYLASDANEVITKIKTTFRAGPVDTELVEEGHRDIDMPDAANVNSGIDAYAMDTAGLSGFGAASGAGMLGLPMGDDDFGLVDSQNNHSRRSLYVDDGLQGGMPTEMTEEETFDLPGLTRGAGAARSTSNSSYGEIERVRRADSDHGEGGARSTDIETDDDDRRSVSSGTGSQRGSRRAEIRRARGSLLPYENDLAAGAGRRGRASAAALDLGAAGEDDYGLGDVLGLNNLLGRADGSGAAAAGEDYFGAAGVNDDYGGYGGDNYDNGFSGADAGAGGGVDEGSVRGDDNSAAPVERKPSAKGAAAAAAEADFPGASHSPGGSLNGDGSASSVSSAGPEFATAGELAESTAAGGAKKKTVAKATGEAAESAAAAAKGVAPRNNKAALKAVAARQPDAVTMLSGETIKSWLSDTSGIVKPRIEEGPARAAAIQANLQLAANARVKFAVAESKKKGAAAAAGAAYAGPLGGQGVVALALLDGLDASAGDRSGSLGGGSFYPVPAVLDTDAEFLALSTLLASTGSIAGPGALASVAPSTALALLAIARGRTSFGGWKRPQRAEESDDNALPAAASAAKQGKGGVAGSNSVIVSADADDGADSIKGDKAAASSKKAGSTPPPGGDENYFGAAGVDDGYDNGGGYGGMDLGGVDADVAADGLVDADGNIAFADVAGGGLLRSPGGGGGSVGSGKDKASSHGGSLAGGVSAERFPGGGGDDFEDPSAAAAAGLSGRRPSRLDFQDDVAAATAAAAAAAEADAKFLSHSKRGALTSPDAPGASPSGSSSSAGSFVGKEKWHPATVEMLSVLASEMTGPEISSSTWNSAAAAGKKRKSRDGDGAVYDLSDVSQGKGSAAEPISFLELAEGGVRRTAAVSFYQLLQLKTWDVIQVEQHKPYGDVLISRTPHFAEAMKELHVVSAVAV